MKLVMMLGQPAGLVALLTCQAEGHEVLAVATRDQAIEWYCRVSDLPIHHESIAWRDGLTEADVLLSVHGREIIPAEVLNLPRHGGINLHPCLWKYKGADPVGRLLADQGTMASVGAHWMTAEVDAGPRVYEYFRSVEGCSTREQVYARLYPVYTLVTRQVLAWLASGQILRHSDSPLEGPPGSLGSLTLG